VLLDTRGKYIKSKHLQAFVVSRMCYRTQHVSAVYTNYNFKHLYMDFEEKLNIPWPMSRLTAIT